MEARAVLDRWPVPEGARPALMKRLSRTALDPSTTSRDATQATRAILEADRLNLQAVTVDLAVEAQTELADEVAELRAVVTEIKEGHQP
jgi:hypothetical protein